MARFVTHSFPVKRFRDLLERKQLVLVPKFQRRKVWDYRIQSYFLDSVIRGFSTPKIYLREKIDGRSKSLVREVVDGQQRLTAILDFLQDKLTISSKDNDFYGDTSFSKLPREIRQAFLDYESTVDIMRDASDEEVLEMFARLNTYTVRLNLQELRNARYHGEFKSAVYRIASDHIAFFQSKGILSAKQIVRMADAELVSELVVGMLHGMQDKKKSLNKYYKDYNDNFASAGTCRDHFKKVISQLNTFYDEGVIKTRFRRKTLFYSIFCVFYDVEFGLPGQKGPYGSIDVHGYPDIRKNLVQLNEQIMSDVPQEKYVPFVVACKQQTDNIEPRQTRFDWLLDLVRPHIVRNR